MDPPPPREAFVKSKFASWLIVRMIGKGDPRENELLNAVTEGNARRLKKMVNTMGEKDRAKFTDMNIDGNGLLQVAAHLGKIEVIRYFVEELGFDVNAGCLSDGVTALASAAMFGEAYVVRYLLEHGADPNKTDETGSVALHFAAKNGYEEVVRLLLSSGARTGIVVAHGTPLHIAVFYRRIGVVKILLDHHVDSNNTSGVWGTPILTALRSAKHGLDESDSLECVKLLVKAGADVNYACPNTPLVVATTAGLTDCIKYLLEVHADPNIPDKQSGRTPVEISASVGRRDHVEILFPFTSSISAVTNWTVEGIIAHGKSRRLTPKIVDLDSKFEIVPNMGMSRYIVKIPYFGMELAALGYAEAARTAEAARQAAAAAATLRAEEERRDLELANAACVRRDADRDRHVGRRDRDFSPHCGGSDLHRDEEWHDLWRDPWIDRALEAQRLWEQAAAIEAQLDFDREQGGRDIGARSPRRQRASPSSDRHRGRRGRSGSPPVVQTIVKDVGGAWPMLTKTNYAEWAMVMKVKLQARHMWDTVWYGDVDYGEDRRALEALLAAVPTEMQSSIVNKRTTKDAWDAIASARIGSDRARRSTLQKLRQDWENLAFKPGEDIDDFVLRLNSLQQRLAQLGDTTIDEERAVEKLLRVVPEKYTQLALSIETLLDFTELTIEEVMGRLKAVDNRKQLPPSEPITIGGKLFFTKEQWLARQQEWKKGEATGSSASGSSSSRKRRPRKWEKARSGALGDANGEHKGSRDDTCHNCGKTGYWAKDCRQAKHGGQAHVAQAQEGDEVAQPVCLAARRDDDAWRWHERFGHLNFGALKQLGNKEMVQGMPRVEHVEQFCDTCVLTKQRRLPFPRQASFRAEEKLELVHGDLCGPVTPATPGGRRFFLLLVDDVSRYMWVVLHDSKAAAADAIKHHQVAAEKECGRKLRVLRTNNGGEFTAAEFAAYCADEGIQRHFSAPYTPQQNGVVERRNQTVVATARALLKQRGMPAIYWEEAVMTAVHLLNRLPTKALDGKTPYEAWHGRKPVVSHLRVFGCLAFAKELNHVGKLDDRSSPGVFIGYAEGVKAYRILDPATQRVRISRDVVFDEGRGWAWDKAVDDGSTSTLRDFVVDYVHFGGAGGASSSSSPSSSTSAPGSPSAPASPPPPTPPATPPSPATPCSPTPAPTPPVEFATPLSNDEDRVDAYHDDEPLRYHTVDNIFGDQPVLGLATHDFEAELHLAHEDGEPCSFAEANGDVAWRTAMQHEMDAVERNRTWVLADLPVGHRAITLKWVYKLKKDEAGAVIKHKARLVARGFVQQEGVDFDDAFAPVARMESVRLLLALAAQEGWRVHHMDVKSAFLNGDLKKEVYAHQPPGFVIPSKENKVLRLRKALYGLWQAPRAWNAKLDSTLKQMGFQQSSHEAAVYRRGKDGNALLVGVYVDDLVITGTKEAEVEAFKEEMKATFQMSDLGLLSFYLGIEVHQDSSGISLRQTAYAKRIVELGGLTGCNLAYTPMEERLKLSRDSTAEEIWHSLLAVSRFMQRPTTEHQQAVKRILRYVEGTTNYGLHYPRCPGAQHFIGYSDSDLAGDSDTSKSTSGMLFFLSKCLISWQSVKQQVVALSSCEAEYIATTTASTQALWLVRLLGDLLGRDAEAVELRVDSKSALALAKNPVFHERSKHIRIKYHFIRSCLEERSIKASYINTQDQLVDLLTKSLGRVKFQEFRARIGMDESCGKVNDRKAELKSHGEKAVKRNDYLAASKIYSEALELDYFDATLYSNRSLCNLQIGEAQKALLDADRCVELRPKWVKGHYREGAALMVLKEHKKAFEAFLNALKLDPANAEIEKVMW
uniref:Gag-pol polyprotein n=1 Tax=Oryza sativa subsp. japonica TaxID=39947 RepID=Q9AUM6_ORYSJ|nr:putative gag-pol polyprotein [Oryza sativa Japonica Group]